MKTRVAANTRLQFSVSWWLSPYLLRSLGLVLVGQDRKPKNKLETMCGAHGRASLVPPKRKDEKTRWVTHFTGGQRGTYRSASPRDSPPPTIIPLARSIPSP